MSKTLKKSPTDFTKVPQKKFVPHESVPAWWNILKGECNLAEAMMILGGEINGVRQTMDMLIKHDPEGKQRFVITVQVYHKAYMELVKEFEIDGTKVWNFNEKEYDEKLYHRGICIADGVRRGEGCVGFSGPRLYRTNKQGKWERVIG